LFEGHRGQIGLNPTTYYVVLLCFSVSTYRAVFVLGEFCYFCCWRSEDCSFVLQESLAAAEESDEEM